jgi:hypothetical protein
MHWLEILTFTLPALVVVLVVERMMRWQFRRQQQWLQQESRLAQQKQLLPARLQAAERLALFLERISPDALVHRHLEGQTHARQFQLQLLMSIRAEFEHNMAQQIYLSATCWEAVKAAKEAVVALVNQAAVALPEEASALDLSRQLMQLLDKQNETPTARALGLLRKEVEAWQ